MNLTEAKKIIDAAVAECCKCVTPESARRKIEDILDSHTEEAVAKLLGFDNKWGDWEVDHCNGRQGESAAGDWLRKTAKEEVDKWLAKQAGALPDLSPAQKKALREDYRNTLAYHVKERLQVLAREHAVEAGGKIWKEIVG